MAKLDCRVASRMSQYSAISMPPAMQYPSMAAMTGLVHVLTSSKPGMWPPLATSGRAVIGRGAVGLAERIPQVAHELPVQRVHPVRAVHRDVGLAVPYLVAQHVRGLHCC